MAPPRTGRLRREHSIAAELLVADAFLWLYRRILEDSAGAFPDSPCQSWHASSDFESENSPITGRRTALQGTANDEYFQCLGRRRAEAHHCTGTHKNHEPTATRTATGFSPSCARTAWGFSDAAYPHLLSQQPLWCGIVMAKGASKNEKISLFALKILPELPIRHIRL